MDRTRITLAAALLLAACGEPPAPSAPPATAQGQASAATAGPATPVPAAPGAPASATAVTEAPVAIAAGALYACVVDAAGERRVTAIELAPKLATLCTENPEMGPCQYERDLCRRNGGRVFAVDGQEITLATEATYDRRVQRIRLNSH